MKCPVCQVNLMMTERNGIEIDYCPDCRGIWLDRGELDKILERSNANSERLQPPFIPSPTFTPQHGYPYKKKKGFLGELFDF